MNTQTNISTAPEWLIKRVQEQIKKENPYEKMRSSRKDEWKEIKE